MLNAERTEREIQLEENLQVEREARKKEQIRVSELENENERLKQIPQASDWRRFKL